jgi:hypothetical protein
MTDLPAYNTFERGLHRLAFAATRAQLGLADLEDGIFAERLETFEIKRPLFITSLPRAGTTLLLEMLCNTGDFASHTYRDMPFVLCPMIWDRLSRRFRKAEVRRQRAHADGMEIGFDSPEALEEVIWRRFWPRKYANTSLELWSAGERDADFEDFLQKHMVKIMALRSAAEAGKSKRRYVSKNNANIARIDLLSAFLPEAQFLIPFRNPADHISSLLAQHGRFAEIHANDAFARDYMGWLGHFEFGSLTKPIDFDGWVTSGRSRELEPGNPEFWARYWLAAYSHLQGLPADKIMLIDYDHMCRQPGETLARLAAKLGLDDPGRLIGQAGRLGSPTKYDTSEPSIPSDILEAINETHDGLMKMAI